MKKLLAIIIITLSFMGCLSEEEIGDTGIPTIEKGAKFKIYTYEEKLDIARKVKSMYMAEGEQIFPEPVYPKVTKVFNEHKRILDSEALKYGNEKAKHELEEWQRASKEVGPITIKKRK